MDEREELAPHLHVARIVPKRIVAGLEDRGLDALGQVDLPAFIERDVVLARATLPLAE